MADLIKFRKGNKANLPNLRLGEPGVALDEGRLYIGGINGNIQIPNMDDVRDISADIAINVKQFGAVGDGITDDTQAIKNAVNAGNRIEFEPNKTYYVTDLIFVKNNTVIDLKNSTIKWYNTTKLTGNNVWTDDTFMSRHFGVFNCHGSRVAGTKQAITAFQPKVKSRDYDMYHSIVTVADTSLYAIGDLVHIATPITSNTNMNYVPGFNILAKIINIAGNDIWLDYYSPFDFTNFSYTNVTIEKINPSKNIIIKNAIIEDTTPWTSYDLNLKGTDLDKIVAGVGIYLGENIEVKNVHAKNTKNPAVISQYGYNIKTKDIRLDKPTYLGGGQGYTVQFCGTMLPYAENIYGNSVRHNVDLSYSAFGKVRNAKEVDGYLGSIDMHGVWEHDINIDDSYGSIQIGNGTAFPLMNERIRIKNCTIPRLVLASTIYGLKVEDSDVNINYHENLTVNTVLFENCSIKIKGGSTFITNEKTGRRTSFQTKNSKIEWLEDGTLPLWRIIKFDDVEIEKGQVGSDAHHCTFSITNAKKINVETKLVNSMVLLATDYTSLVSGVQYNLKNNIVTVNNNAVAQINMNRQFDFSRLQYVEGIIDISDNNIYFDSTQFTGSLPYDIVSASPDLTFTGCKLTLRYQGNTAINKQTDPSKMRSMVYKKKNVLDIVAYKNKIINGLERSNLATELVSNQAVAGQYIQIAKVILSDQLASASISFDLVEVYNGYSAKIVDAVLTVQQNLALGNESRKQFSAKTLNVLTTSDVVLVENNTATETTINVFVKALSDGDIYLVNFYNQYTRNDAFIETYRYNTFVDSLPSGTTTNITVI